MGGERDSYVKAESKYTLSRSLTVNSTGVQMSRVQSMVQKQEGADGSIR